MTAKEIPLKQYSDLLAKYLKPQTGRVIILAVLLLTSIAVQLINPQIVRFFIDTASARSIRANLDKRRFALPGMAIFNQVLTVLATYFGENVGWTATEQMRLIWRSTASSWTCPFTRPIRRAS